jgi:hypothetical protein
MPYLRFLSLAGGALVASMFVANAYLPAPAASQPASDIDRSTIRISSLKKGPERVVIDTSLPTVVPTAPLKVTIAEAPAPAPAASREAFAQIPDEQATRLPPTEAKPAVKEAKQARKAERRHVAARRPHDQAPPQQMQPRRFAGDPFSPWFFR